MRMFLRRLGLRLLRALGTTVVDQRTGEPVGRAFFIGWRGRVIAIGLENEPPLRPHFLPQERLTYWKQEIGFSSHPHPDFPHESTHDAERPVDPSDAR
jgi:hypothetical protein